MPPSSVCIFSDYNSEEKDVIRPLKFVKISTTKCHLNSRAINLYYKSLFLRDGDFTQKQPMEILKNPRNYNFEKNPITSLGKLCDVVIRPEVFQKAVIAVGRKSTSNIKKS
jgi:hypothetical protein